MEALQADQGTGGDRSLGRRGLLKGAAAAGVGIAAWSVPSITSLGGTPVYAGVCTVGFTTFNLSVRNTDCGGCTGSVRIKDFTTSQCPVDNFAPGARLANGNCTAAVPEAGVCPSPGTGGICVGGVPAGQVCAVRIILQQNNCDGTAIRTSVSAPFSAAGFVALPGGVDCRPGEGGNLFTRVQIVCSTQAACLPASTTPTTTTTIPGTTTTTTIPTTTTTTIPTTTTTKPPKK